MDPLPKTKEFLGNWFIPATERSASFSVLLFTLYMQAARTLCWCRVKIDGEEFPMLYAYHFAKSGAYKDRPKEQLSELILPEMLKAQRILKDSVYQMQADEISRICDSLGKVDAREYRKTHRVRKFHNVCEKGTEQGFQNDRIGCAASGIGHVHYEHDEIVSFLRERDTKFFSLMNLTVQGWNKGNTKSPSLVTEFREHVDGVPITKFIHSSAKGLSTDPKALSNLLTLLESGDAKRSFLIFEEGDCKVKRTDEEESEDEAKVAFNSEAWVKHFERMFEMVRPSLDEAKNWKYKSISSKGVRALINKYRNHCFDLAAKEPNDMLRIEISDRWWRAKRLSASIAFFEHPDDLSIREEDFLFAAWMANNEGKGLRKMIGIRSEDKFRTMFTHMSSGVKVGLTEIRHSLGLRNSKEVKEALETLREMANEEGKVLEREQGRGIAEYWTVADFPEHAQMPESLDVRFSVGESADPNNTAFHPSVCKWADFLPYCTDRGHSWSPSIFKNDYREGKFTLEIPSFLVMDCDNTCPTALQTTVEDAKAALSKFEYLIYTTKSHLKEKPHKTYTDPANERFRIVLPVKSPLPIKEGQLKRIAEGFVQEFFPKATHKTFDLAATGDIARYFWGNPGDIHANRGLMMDWRMIMPDEKGSLPFGTKRTLDPNSLIPKGTVWRAEHGNVTVEDARKLKNDKTLPVHCNLPGHEDQTPSAYLFVNRNGNVQFQCSACDAFLFEK